MNIYNQIEEIKDMIENNFKKVRKAGGGGKIYYFFDFYDALDLY